MALVTDDNPVTGPIRASAAQHGTTQLHQVKTPTQQATLKSNKTSTCDLKCQPCKWQTLNTHRTHTSHQHTTKTQHNEIVLQLVIKLRGRHNETTNARDLDFRGGRESWHKTTAKIVLAMGIDWAFCLWLRPFCLTSFLELFALPYPFRRCDITVFAFLDLTMTVWQSWLHLETSYSKPQSRIKETDVTVTRTM